MMDRDELAQWLCDYLREHYQAFDVQQQVVVAIRIKELGDMADALLEALHNDALQTRTDAFEQWRG